MSSPALRALLVLAAIVVAPTLLAAQQRNERTFWKQRLGKHLFESEALSLDGTVSCASCHVPERSFQSGEPETEGILHTGSGRNVPTLLGVGSIARFPVPMERGKDLRIGAATLADRCLTPIENPLEMGSSVAGVVRRLREDESMRDAFELAFGPAVSPVTPARLGEALAAHLVALDPGTTRYDRFLAGDRDALDITERLGARAFEKAGCASCHSGPAFSDGLMHVAFLPDGRRARDQAQRGAQIARAAVRGRGDLPLPFPKEGLARDLFRELQLASTPRGGCEDMPGATQRVASYGGQTPGVTIEMQTTPLVHVALTAPYFRDGSADDLEGAIATHVRELKRVRDRAQQVDAFLRANEKSRPPRDLRGKHRPGPELDRVGELEIRGIAAFLRTLSPEPAPARLVSRATPATTK